jgi:hypothetical protein
MFNDVAQHSIFLGFLAAVLAIMLYVVSKRTSRAIATFLMVHMAGNSSHF